MRICIELLDKEDFYFFGRLGKALVEAGHEVMYVVLTGKPYYGYHNPYKLGIIYHYWEPGIGVEERRTSVRNLLQTLRPDRILTHDFGSELTPIGNSMDIPTYLFLDDVFEGTVTNFREFGKVLVNYGSSFRDAGCIYRAYDHPNFIWQGDYKINTEVLTDLILTRKPLIALGSGNYSALSPFWKAIQERHPDYQFVNLDPDFTNLETEGVIQPRGMFDYVSLLGLCDACITSDLHFAEVSVYWGTPTFVTPEVGDHFEVGDPLINVVARDTVRMEKYLKAFDCLLGKSFEDLAKQVYITDDRQIDILNRTIEIIDGG